jgi:hypothetical protein
MFVGLSLLRAAACFLPAVAKLLSHPKMQTSAGHFGIPWRGYQLIGVAELAADGHGHTLGRSAARFVTFYDTHRLRHRRRIGVIAGPGFGAPPVDCEIGRNIARLHERDMDSGLPSPDRLARGHRRAGRRSGPLDGAGIDVTARIIAVRQFKFGETRLLLRHPPTTSAPREKARPSASSTFGPLRSGSITTTRSGPQLCDRQSGGQAGQRHGS